MSTVDRLSDDEKLELLQGTLEVLILRSLKLEPNHAYGISQFLQQQSDSEFLVDNGSLYPALQRLLQRKWIAGQWKTSPNECPTVLVEPSTDLGIRTERRYLTVQVLLPGRERIACGRAWTAEAVKICVYWNEGRTASRWTQGSQNGRQISFVIGVANDLNS
jgi:DNA-binding PadR family transcriptional regulator